MLVLYNIGVQLYYFIAKIASIWNTKAKRWLNGRQEQKVTDFQQSIWFHFASLGEFEQGRPVLEATRKQYSSYKIVVTFFSPSGYEIRKNTPLADAVYYLPLDTASNARQFIHAIKPAAAVFTKYEYWYHFFNELHRQQIPLYVISAIFRPQQVFFKWYGSLHRQILTKVTHFFTQNQASEQLLAALNLHNVTVSGDTRFDRVWANALHPRTLPEIEAFKNDKPVFIAGSTWPQDEELIAGLVKQHTNWQFIIAPHEIHAAQINKLISLLPAGTVIKFSEIANYPTSISEKQVLIIDNIGMLSALYQYGSIAYIGGGFGAGIHNTLEAAAFGLPVIFGSNYAKFKEAHDLIEQKAGFSIRNNDELQDVVDRLIQHPEILQEAGQAAHYYTENHIGATDTIMRQIRLKT
ncbi:3-deoxy-D-manno-octulosonic acid transferase [Mucilaginibacter robiniae]|uniref:3-deoxy-D-manno-octulosonic acid transferase n=1 Tax=Mucilaginibacter robiniae TaxID=2728022 RepID=A0A7L5E3U1_9SPHI|nr:glycosyltransferase N-terminal domain-containing protein [Mucilaginibacter robiniae]QJD95016.1 3-deoxy-D-manno-octulosonic acid transferase [Mucilaginibacter robiniae]